MKRTLKLKGRVAVITLIAMVALTFMLQVIAYMLFSKNVRDSYVDYATAALNEAEAAFEKNCMGDLISAQSMDEGYEETRIELNRIKNSMEIKYLYSLYFEDIHDLSTACYAINGKSEEEISASESVEDIYSYMGERCEEGSFSERDLKIFSEAILSGQSGIYTLENNTPEYGNMLTCYTVICDSSGKANAILGVDIDINKIKKEIGNYILSTGVLAIVIAGIFIGLFIMGIEKEVTKPVTALSKSADAFVKQLKNETPPEDLSYEVINVKTQDEIATLSDNVRSMANGLKDYMINLRSVTAEKERIGAELSLATKIQADMLPNIYPAFPERDEFDIYATMTPAKEVGGDFYDFFLVDSDHLCMVMADVSGKGIPAALFMMASKIILANNAMLGKSPAQILADTNAAICSNNREEMFVTVWLGILEISTGIVKAANAGHEYPAIYNENEKFELYKDKHGFVIGAMEGVRYKEYELQLTPGASLFVYTDGVAEATNEKNELFGTDRMLEALNKSSGAKPQEVLENVRCAVDGFVNGAEQFDDLTMLCMKYIGPVKKREEKIDGEQN